MRILVTNDDGIDGEGLKVAEKIARSLSDDVWVVAPAIEQSGASHSLTLLRPMRLCRLDERHFTLTGTPTDCVMMAVANLMADKRPDLVISGVNRGVNIADDLTYSGTVGAAMEGAALGIHSVALSQGYPFDDKHHHMQWICAETHGPGLMKKLLAAGWPGSVLLNVNFPDCAPDAVKGIAVAPQGRRDKQEVRFDRRVDMRGYPYFWLGYKRDPRAATPGNDIAELLDGKITVTPLHLDLTERKTLAALQSALAG